MIAIDRLAIIPPPAHRNADKSVSLPLCRAHRVRRAAQIAARSCLRRMNRLCPALRSSAADVAELSHLPNARRPVSRPSVLRHERTICVAAHSKDLNKDQLWYLSLCAGYGGLDLGLHIAEPSARAVGYVERDAHAAATLMARMDDAALGDAPVWDDLATFDSAPWRGCVDIILAGYPCQPFSYAGKRSGADDPRHLWPQVARIIREAQPRAVLLENVEGHITLGLADVAQELRHMGYTPKAGLFSAAETGAPHWRKRLFILAYANRTDGRKHASVEDQRARHRVRMRSRRGVSGWPQARGHDVEHNGHVPAGARRVAGRPADHRTLPLYPAAPGELAAWGRTLAQRPELEPAVLRVADGLADRVDRCHGTGNGVCPLAAALAYRTLKADFEIAVKLS